ncbi:MAG: hypothetical protein GTO54_03085, partial [Nitrososphaeria archaeon]|nr:hypothetical protein [Nitrososphaeria archaeon]
FILYFGLAILIHYFKGRDVVITSYILTMMILNSLMFQWPFWPIIVVGTVLAIQLGLNERLVAMGTEVRA